MRVQCQSANAKRIVAAHKAFTVARSAKELFSAAIRAKAAGDESLLERFQEIMAASAANDFDKDIPCEQISEEDVERFLSLIDSPQLQKAVILP